MTTPGLESAGHALMSDLTATFGELTPDKGVAFFPGIPVDDRIVQGGAVNVLRLGQWLGLFDTTPLVRPGEAFLTAPPSGGSATALYQTVVNSGRALEPTSLHGQQLTQRFARNRRLLEEVRPEVALGTEPDDWPVPGATTWQSARTAAARSAEATGAVVRVPDLDEASGVTVVRWLKAVGDSVGAQEPLLAVSADDALSSVVSPAEGTLLEITAPEGAVVGGGTRVAVVGPGQPPPETVVTYQHLTVLLTRRTSGTPWWDAVLLSDTGWFVPGRAAGGLLPPASGGVAHALPYALLIVRDVVVSSPHRPTVDDARAGPVVVSRPGGSTGEPAPLGRPGMQAVGLIAEVLPPLPPADDPGLVPAGEPARYEPFPGAGFFTPGRRSPVIASMHDRLVEVGCDRYTSATHKDVWGDGDRASYAAWQKALGFSGKDADGRPGPVSWDLLRVPAVP